MREFVWVGANNDYDRIQQRSEANQMQNVCFCEGPDKRLKGLARLFYKLHTSETSNKLFSLPFKAVWAPSILDKKTKKYLKTVPPQDICFLFCSKSYGYRQLKTFRYLRKKYKNCKIVYLFNDTYRHYSRIYPTMNLQSLASDFDCILTYNKKDADEYGFLLYPPKLRDYSQVKENAELAPCDLFFIGREKGRLDKILEVYSFCKEKGLACDFHIVGVDTDKQRFADEISYNKPMSYEQVLTHVKRAHAILNIVQEDAEGITLRDYEAIAMNKVLITNNPVLLASDFYTEEKVVRLEGIGCEWEKIKNADERTCWKGQDVYTVEKWYAWLENQIETKN